MIIIGTTPTLTFSTNIAENLIDEIYITLVQSTKNSINPVFICEHDKTQCTFGNMTVSTTLTESETAWIDPMLGPVQMQVTIIDTNGKIYKSEIVREDVCYSLRGAER